jgi:galactokinase
MDYMMLGMGQNDWQMRKSLNAPDRFVIASAPARVNLLGEHTDYTGGYVLPLAIGFFTQVQLVSNSRSYALESDRFVERRTFPTGETPAPIGNWTDYPVGVLRELQLLGIDVPPFTLRLSGDVPLGAGLSSSASVEVATCIALLKWAGTTLSVKEIALLCQRAENRFVGSPCGIMDQAVITAALKGRALLIHTRDLRLEPVPLDAGALSNCRIVICNSEIKHSVAMGDYGLRRKEVEDGQAVIASQFGASDLAAVSLDQLELVRARLTERSYRRCRHIITENARVLSARSAMIDGDAVRLGGLMLQGHVSQRDDFECSCVEVDHLVETAIAFPGCHGARLTGGGFGGCTVNLVEIDAITNFQHQILLSYRQRFGIDAHIWVSEAVDGAVLRSRFQAAPGGTN